MSDARAETVSALNDLLAMQHGYLSANATFHDRAFREHVRATADAVQLRHQRQINELADMVQRFGGVPRKHAGLRRLLPVGRVVAGNLGGDSSLLRAARTNAVRLQAAYESARAADLPRPVTTVLDKHVTELTRERAWIELRHQQAQTLPGKA